jgi:nucleotide-binding universal stress UspA family protein
LEKNVRATMITLKSILAPISGRDACRAALSAAAFIGELAGAEVRGLYVIDPSDFLEAAHSEGDGGQPLARGQVQAWAEKKAADGEAAARELFEEMTAGFSGGRSFETEKGRVPEVILDREKAADLVIMGRAPSGGKGRIQPAGEKIYTAVEKAFSPVLVIQNELHTGKGLLLSMGRGKASHSALRQAALFAGLLDADVFMVVSGRNEDEKVHLIRTGENYLKPHGIRPRTIWKKTDQFRAVTASLEATSPAMLITGAFEEWSFRELLFGSYTDQLLRRISLPALYCH